MCFGFFDDDDFIKFLSRSVRFQMQDVYEEDSYCSRYKKPLHYSWQ